MKRFALVFSLSVLFSTAAQAGRSSYFFLPPRDLFVQRPDYFVYGVLGNPYFGMGSFCPPLAGPGASSFFPSFHRGTYEVILNVPTGTEVVRANFADLIFNVNPSNALIYVDNRLIGSARDFDTERERLTLLEGAHHLRIEFPGYEAFESDMEIIPDRTLHLDIDLELLATDR
ncbi:MAG: PEGA domain-containing protein [Acidobacteriota bacterium]